MGTSEYHYWTWVPNKHYGLYEIFLFHAFADGFTAEANVAATDQSDRRLPIDAKFKIEGKGGRESIVIDVSFSNSATMRHFSPDIRSKSAPVEIYV